MKKLYFIIKGKYSLYSSLVLLFVLFFSVRITFYDKQAEIAAKTFLILVEKREYALSYLLLSKDFQDIYPYWQFVNDMNAMQNSLGIITSRYGETHQYFRISVFPFSHSSHIWSGEFEIVGKDELLAGEEISVVKEEGEYKIATYHVKDGNQLKAKNKESIFNISDEELNDIKKIVVRTKNTLKSLVSTVDNRAELIIGKIIYEENPQHYKEIEDIFSYLRTRNKEEIKKKVKFGVWSKFIEFNVLKYHYIGQFEVSKFLPNKTFDKILVYEAQLGDKEVQIITIFFFCDSEKILDVDYYYFSIDNKSGYFIARKESYLEQLTRAEPRQNYNSELNVR